MTDAELQRLRSLREARIHFGLEKAPQAGNSNVVVYSTPTCPYCVQAKRYLEMKKIAYQEVDLTRVPGAAAKLMQATGQTGVPQININGHWIMGFDRHAMDRELGL